jgi:hypothetical protein
MFRNWLSYFWCGGLALFLGWALSGCRWGNHEVDAPYSGPLFYETEFTGVQLCATLNGQSQANCVTQQTRSFIPSYQLPLTSTFALDDSELSNPVILNPLDADLASALNANFEVFHSDTENAAFFIDVDSQKNLSWGISSSLDLFDDTNTAEVTCAADVIFDFSGKLTATGPYTSGSTAPLSGRMALDQTITLTLQGTGCAQAALCYSDATQCDGNARADIVSFYQKFIDSGVLSAADLVNLHSLSYTIHYQ